VACTYTVISETLAWHSAACICPWSGQPADPPHKFQPVSAAIVFLSHNNQPVSAKILPAERDLYVVGYMFYMIRTNAKLKIPNIDIFAEEQEQIDIYKSQLYITWLNWMWGSESSCKTTEIEFLEQELY